MDMRIFFRRMKENKPQIIGIVVAFIIMILALIFLRGSKDILYFILGLAFVIAGLPFFISLI